MRARRGPALPTIRCHGSASAAVEALSAAAATRAPPGRPASSATWPYVATRPRGTARIASCIRRWSSRGGALDAIVPGGYDTRTMRIQVLYFAVLRERIGRDAEALELADGATVGAALDALAARHAVVRGLRGRFRVAVNEDFVDDAHRLVGGDELALIPPVAGGSAAASRHAELRDDGLSLDRCVAAVTGPGMGGIVTFTGMVRDHSRGTTVERLEYSAYDGMARKVLAALCDELEAELPGVRLAVEHRVGALVVGDLAVVIAAAAPHRAEAFAACRAMIDRLKERAPIWKKEFGLDGAAWVGLGP